MGIGIYIGTELKPSGFFKKKPDVNKLLNKIGIETARYIQKYNLDCLFSQNFRDNILFIQLHPAEEDIEFFEEAGYLVCSAKTSSAGPGYHAFLVKLLEEIAKVCGLNWVWESEDKGFCDEAAYFEFKDFGQLQVQMCTYLKWLAELLENKPDSSKFALSLPTNIKIEDPYFAASPMGFWDKRFFNEISQLKPDDILDYGSKFFPWWNEDIDAEFWRNAALVKMWTQIKWHPPLPHDEEQMSCLSSAYQCLNNATNIDAGIEFPVTEFEEIKKLLQVVPNDIEYPIPEENRIGFHRYNLLCPTTGSWSIAVPGYFYQALEDNDSTAVFWYDTRTIYASSLTVEPKDEPPDFSTSESALKTFDFESDHLRGYGELLKNEDEGNNYWQLACKIAAPGSIQLLTIIFDKPQDLQWAIKVFESAFITTD